MRRLMLLPKYWIQYLVSGHGGALGVDPGSRQLLNVMCGSPISKALPCPRTSRANRIRRVYSALVKILLDPGHPSQGLSCYAHVGGGASLAPGCARILPELRIGGGH